MDTSTKREYASSKEVANLYGLQRTFLYDLVRRGLVQSVSLRRPGSKKGKRLFYVPSIQAYLDRQLEEQNK